jgi:dTDP-4-amino-4,6-dideoxygalactose transaminase
MTSNLSDWRIPLSDLDFGPEESAAVERVLRSKWLSMGPEVQAFEGEFAAMQRAKHAIAVSSATAGLHLSLLALGVGNGDEIIQPALNFVAAANMTVAAGAKPVFADIISLAEPTIDPEHVERLITPRTRAVMVMHYGGNLCRMAELLGLCQRKGIALIEDACHAVGASYRDALQRPPHGVMAGSIGDVGTFSFFANKNLVTGEGGMVVTNRDDIATRVRQLRSHGMTSLTWDRYRGHASSYDVIEHGFNYRLDEMRAALGRVQLTKLAQNNERRRKLLRCYRKELEGSAWCMPFEQMIDDSAGHLMVAVAPSTEARARVIEILRGARIQTSVHYPNVTGFKAFLPYKGQGVENTIAYTSRALTLPLYPKMLPTDILDICAPLKSA